MKKYIIMLLASAVMYGCSNNNTSSVVNKSGTADSSKTVKKKLLNQSAAQSLYSIADSFSTQDNESVTLASFSGKPTVIGMVFTNCGYACPRLTSDIQGIAEKLKDNEDKVNFVLITFDTERDIPSQLKSFADRMQLNKNWTLLHGNEEAVRTLAVLLDVQFEKDADGNFSHSNIVSVLDKNGALNFQKEGLEADHKETIDKINELIK